eukprot:6861927-Karenia_brevis.AAC.1
MVNSDDMNTVKVGFVGELREEEILEIPPQMFDVLEEPDEEMSPEARKMQVRKEREILEEILLP